MEVLGQARGLLVLLAACVAGCDKERASELTVEEFAREHAAPDLELEGRWIQDGAKRSLILHRNPEGWFFVANHVSIDLPPEVTSGVRTGSVLVLDAPLSGSKRLHLCRVGRRSFLLDQSGARFEWAPSQRLSEFEVFRPGPTVVRPLPAGGWEGVGGSGRSWLEVESTGIPDGYRLRCSRRADGEATPVNHFARARWEGPVLRCEPALLGAERWRLRQSGEEHWLEPEESVALAGLRFRLVSRSEDSPWSIHSGVDGPDDLEER